METTTTTEAEPNVAAGKLALAAKCAHAGCACTVEAGERFCSEYCLVQAERTDDDALAADGDDAGCTCGHAECETAAAPSVPPVLLNSTPTG